MLLPNSSEGDKLHEALLTQDDMYQKEMANYREVVNNQYRYRNDREDSLGVPRYSSGYHVMELYAARWFILFLFVCSSVANGLVLLTWSVMEEKSCDYFDGVSDYAISIMTVTFQVCFLPGTYLCFRILNSRNDNLRLAMLGAGMMNTLGCIIRALGAIYVHDINVDASYWVIMVGTMVCSLALPFYWIIPVKIAAVWFSISERDAIMTLGVLSSPFGNAVGAVLPSFFIKEDDDDNTELDDGVNKLLLSQGGISFIVFILVYIGFQSQPECPPSKAAALVRVIESDQAEDNQSEQRKNLNNHLAKLFGDCNFCTLLVSFCLCMGHLYSLSALVGSLPGDYSNEDYGFVCVLVSSFGIISALMSGLILNCTIAYRSFYKCIYILAIGGWLFFFSQCKDNNSTYLFISSATLGTLVVPTIPAIIVNVAESTYPTPEDVSLGCLFVASNLCSIVFVFIGDGLLTLGVIDSESGVFPYSIWLVVSMLVALPFVLYYSGDYARSTQDRDQRMALD